MAKLVGNPARQVFEDAVRSRQMNDGPKEAYLKAPGYETTRQSVSTTRYDQYIIQVIQRVKERDRKARLKNKKLLGIIADKDEEIAELSKARLAIQNWGKQLILSGYIVVFILVMLFVDLPTLFYVN